MLKRGATFMRILRFSLLWALAFVAVGPCVLDADAQVRLEAKAVTGWPVVAQRFGAALAAQLRVPMLPSNFAEVMERVSIETKLSPEAMEGRLTAKQVRQMQKEVGAYASRLIGRIDRSPQDAQLAQEVLALHQADCLVPKELRPKVGLYAAQAAKLPEQIAAAGKIWKKDEAAPIAGSDGKKSSSAKLHSKKDSIASSPEFKEWLQEHSQDPDAALAARLAAKMTWEDVDGMSRGGGVSPQLQEDFASSGGLRAWEGLERAVQDLTGEHYHLINKGIVGQPLWHLAGQQLDAGHLALSDAVRQSVAQRIAEVSQGLIKPRADRVGQEAVLRNIKGRNPEAWVSVHASGQDLWFRFSDGQYDVIPPSKLVAPQ